MSTGEKNPEVPRTKELQFQVPAGSHALDVPPLIAGSFFEDIDGVEWRVTKATMVEKREPFPYSFDPPVPYRYEWKFLLEEVI